MASKSGRFAVLVDDNDSSDSDSGEGNRKPMNSFENTSNINNLSVEIPNYEDLSSCRADEEMVLEAIYGSDFSSHQGTWGQKKLVVKVRPPDLEPKQIGCSVDLSIQVSPKYPYVLPKIQLENVKGLSKEKQNLLLSKLQSRAVELAQVGSVMVTELVQVTEDLLLENNVDPTLSSWELMKAREAKEKAEREEMERARQSRLKYLLVDSEQSSGNLAASAATGTVQTRKLLSPGNSNRGGITPRTTDDDFRSPPALTDIEKELARQRDAIEAANKHRMVNVGLFERKSSSATDALDVDATEIDDDDDDFDDDEAPPALTGASRYQHDFIEMGILGRGGGGEVVKAKNRLDRRIYAIKKILLESEKGTNAKLGKIQNKKLRREVTTISRMTHKNIVRYYQAWVEGGDADQALDEDGEIVEDADCTGDLLKDKLENDSEEGGDNDQGWWTKPPKQERKSSSRDGTDSSASDFDDTSSSPSSSSWSEDEGPSGMSDLAEDFNFNDQTYQNLFNKKKETSSSENKQEDASSVWDEDSSVKVDSSKKQSILVRSTCHYVDHLSLRKMSYLILLLHLTTVYTNGILCDHPQKVD
jgi:translation initiation factor 2-alpha kinase 4